MATKEVRTKLRAKFPANQVKQRVGAGGMKLDYVAGETVIERLLEATADEESGYAWQSNIIKVEQIKSDQWVAVVQGHLLIQGDMGTGVGAMVNRDVDMAVKSANTEALKNAAKNGFGIGLELWDKEYRATLGQQRRLLEGSESAMKQEVFRIAKERLGNDKPSASEVAKLFGVKAGDLSDADGLRSILEAEGVL